MNPSRLKFYYTGYVRSNARLGISSWTYINKSHFYIICACFSFRILVWIIKLENLSRFGILFFRFSPEFGKELELQIDSSNWSTKNVCFNKQNYVTFSSSAYINFILHRRIEGTVQAFSCLVIVSVFNSAKGNEQLITSKAFKKNLFYKIKILCQIWILVSCRYSMNDKSHVSQSFDVQFF